MRLNSAFLVPTSLIQSPRDAIGYIRLFFVKSGVVEFCEDMELEVGIRTINEGIPVHIVAKANPDLNRLTLFTAMSGEFDVTRKTFQSLASAINGNISHVSAEVLEDNGMALGLESFLLLAHGTCLTNQLDHLIDTHMASVVNLMPIIGCFLHRNE